MLTELFCNCFVMKMVPVGNGDSYLQNSGVGPVVVSLLLKVQAVWCLYLQWFPWYQRCRLSGVCAWCGFFGAEGAGYLVFVPVVGSLMASVQVVWCLYL